MKLNKENIGNVLVVTIKEKEANLSNSDHFKEAIFEDIEKGARNLILSFIEVDYIDSSFLGALVAILKSLIPLKGELTLIEMNGDILNLFELTRLDKIFVLKPSLKIALQNH